MATIQPGHPSLSLTACPKCHGEGKLQRPPSRKARLRYKRARMEGQDDLPPPSRVESCPKCESSGLVPMDDNEATSDVASSADPVLPHVAIVGGGLGGLALAIACRHRSIPFTVYERDKTFSQRRQGYGLTMQQASKALRCFGISAGFSGQGITSTKHVVHTSDGTLVGEWGLRKWGGSQRKRGNSKNINGKKRQNVHVARQSLRRELLDALGGDDQLEWNCQLLDYREQQDRVELTFRQGSNEVKRHADVLVGADGIRSTVRRILIGEEKTPLRYLDCLVVLGICKRADIRSDSFLLDGETVFQTADGTTRLYAMPYSTSEYMWQLSFPMNEALASDLSQQGSSSLKKAALEKCEAWHSPISELLSATPEALVSGYPVYDRALPTSEMLNAESRVTLLGDAAHPMSPFKGQGANQALLDALSLARTLHRMDFVPYALEEYENEMLERSAVKVKSSADAAHFLHTEVAIREGNVTRGGAARSAESSAI